MPHLPALRLVLPLLMLAAAGGSALAQSTPGSAGSAAVPASAPVALSAGTAAAKGKQPATRDFLTDTPPQLAGVASVKLSSDGTVTTIQPSAALQAAVQGYKPLAPSGGAAPAPASAAAPLEQVKDASVYPYRAAGEIEVHYGNNYYYCTGVLIGPKTVATSANCLYGFDEAPTYTDKVIFYPAVNDGNAPFGSFEWSDAIIMQSFVDATQHEMSDSTFPFSIGLVHLKDAVGDKLGWFGFQTDLNQSYTAKAISYGGGDMLHKMTSTSCPVDAASMYRSFAFPNPCDASPFGSPFYMDDPSGGGGKLLQALNVGSFQDGSSVETRISPVVYQWIVDNRQ